MALHLYKTDYYIDSNRTLNTMPSSTVLLLVLFCCRWNIVFISFQRKLSFKLNVRPPLCHFVVVLLRYIARHIEIYQPLYYALMNVFLFGAKEKYIDIKDRLPLMAVGDRSQCAPSLDSEKKNWAAPISFLFLYYTHLFFFHWTPGFSKLGYGFNEESVVVNRGRPRATRANQSVPPSTPTEMWVQFQRIRQHFHLGIHSCDGRPSNWEHIYYSSSDSEFFLMPSIKLYRRKPKGSSCNLNFSRRRLGAEFELHSTLWLHRIEGKVK